LKRVRPFNAGRRTLGGRSLGVELLILRKGDLGTEEFQYSAVTGGMSFVRLKRRKKKREARPWSKRGG